MSAGLTPVLATAMTVCVPPPTAMRMPEREGEQVLQTLLPQGRFVRETRHVVAAVRMLVLGVMMILGLSQAPTHPELYWAVTIGYGLTVMGTLFVPGGRNVLRRARWFIFLLDVFAISMVIVLRGAEVQGLLTAAFTLTLVAAVLQGVGNSLINAFVVSVVYITLTRWGAPAYELLSFPVLAQLAFFVVVAVLMGDTAEDARFLTEEHQRAIQGRTKAERKLRSNTVDLKSVRGHLKEMRANLAANERMYTLGMLSAGLGHEMRSPLSAVSAGAVACTSIADEIRAALDLGHPASELVSEIQESAALCQAGADQLIHVVGDLSTLARGGPPSLVALDPTESLRSAHRFLKEAAAGSIRVELEVEDTAPIRGDPGRLLQIWLNLGRNAIEAMGEQAEGLLRLSLRALSDEAVEIRFEDNGPGIPDALKARIFEPFVTTKAPGKGTGLGLHLVNEIVEAHEGRIECVDQPGGGTCFIVQLPVIRDGQEEGTNDERN